MGRSGMKLKLSNLLAPLVAIFLFTLTVKAQDELPVQENQNQQHREVNLDEDKTLIYDHPSHSTTVRDSSQSIVPVRVIQGATKNSKPENHKSVRKDKEEEDALSFNFIYYMFQKFKMSDLIDQN